MKRQDWVRGILSLVVVLIASCGGGGSGGGSTPPPTTQPPSGLQYPSHSAYVIQQAVTPLTPTVTGQVTSYSISPTLPAGLTFNVTTGVISGTPTVIAASVAYTVTATNDGGSTTATVSIAVNDVPPTAVYASPYYAFTANVATQAIKPTLGGGAITNWSVNPTLPTGLTLSSTDGTISGIPTAGSAPTVYTVTAGNSGGSVTANLTIAVAAAPLIDLGHTSSISVLRATASRLVSWDGGHWVLQDYASGTTLAQGDYVCGVTAGCTNVTHNQSTDPVDIEGSVVLDPLTDGVELRSAADGHLLSKITAAEYAWWQLALDGSYLAGGSFKGMMVWSPSGQVLVSKSGDYSGARAFAAPGQLLVAGGGAGKNVIETISVPTGTSSLSPVFQGQIASWFPDGTRFLTTQGTTLWTYSSAAVQQDVAQPPNLTTDVSVHGVGNYVWTFNSIRGLLNIYPVGATNAPPVFTGTYAGAVSSGNTLAVFPSGTAQITAIDLSGATPTSTSHSLPVSGPSTYVTIPGGAWVVGASAGVLVDGASLTSSQPRFLALGRAFSIAGSSKYFSVATASGRIFNYDNSTNAVVSSINFPGLQLAASASGAVLAAIENTEGKSSGFTLNVYSLPGGNLTASLPYNPISSQMTSHIPLALSAAGDVLLAPLVNTSGCKFEAINLASSSPLWCGTTNTAGGLMLSPDGTLVADSPGSLPGGSTPIYKNGTLAGAAAAAGIGWIDNNRLYANVFYVAPDGVPVFGGGAIYDATGHLLSNLSLPQLASLDVVTSDSIYASDGHNAIYSLTNGATLWSSGNKAGVGTNTASAVSGSQVIFVSGALVLAQPH